MSNTEEGLAPDSPRRREMEERLRRLHGLPGEEDYRGQEETKTVVPYLETRDMDGPDGPSVSAEKERAREAMQFAGGKEERDAIRREHSERRLRGTDLDTKGAAPC